MARNARQVRLRRPRHAKEVTENHDKAARPRDTTQRTHRHREWRCGVGRLAFTRPISVLDEFVQEAQRSLPSQAWLQLAVAGVAENQAAEAIATMMRSPGQQGRCPARVDRLVTAARREMHVRSQVHHDEYGPFPLFAEQLGVGRRTTRRHPPIDRSRIVTRLVRTRLVELHAATAKMRDIRSGLQRANTQHVERDGACGPAESDEPGLADADRRRVLWNVVEPDHEKPCF